MSSHDSSHTCTGNANILELALNVPDYTRMIHALTDAFRRASHHDEKKYKETLKLSLYLLLNTRALSKGANEHIERICEITLKFIKESLNLREITGMSYINIPANHAHILATIISIACSIIKETR